MLRIKHKVFVTRGSIAQGYASSCPGTPIGEPPPGFADGGTGAAWGVDRH
jgi:hypothetical protein